MMHNYTTLYCAKASAYIVKYVQKCVLQFKQHFLYKLLIIFNILLFGLVVAPKLRTISTYGVVHTLYVL